MFEAERITRKTESDGAAGNHGPLAKSPAEQALEVKRENLKGVENQLKLIKATFITWNNKLLRLIATTDQYNDKVLEAEQKIQWLKEELVTFKEIRDSLMSELGITPEGNRANKEEDIQ